ncbi:CHAT domain-containing protein [Phormidium nigroviride]
MSIQKEVEAAGLFNQGIRHCKNSRFREALASWEQALIIYREIGNRQGEKNSLRALGDCLLDMGDNQLLWGQFQLAIDYYQQLLETLREIGNRRGEAKSLENLGNAYQLLGQYQLAIDYYHQSLAIIKYQTDDRFGAANSHNNLATAYQSLGEYQLAIKYHQQALEIARETEDRLGEANSLGNLGTAYYSLGQYQLAIDYYQQSLQINREISNRSDTVSTLGNIAAVYDSLGEYQKALDYYQQFLEIWLEIGYHQQDFILNNIIIKKVNKGIIQTEEMQFRMEIAICEIRLSQISDDHQKVLFFDTQVDIYKRYQELLVSKNRFLEALVISEKGRTRVFIDLLKRRLKQSEQSENESKSDFTVNHIQKVAQNQNATLVEYSIVFEDIYIWVIQPTGNITFRRANLTPLESRNKSLKDLREIILKARVSIGVDEKDNNQNKIQLETEDKRDSQSNFPLLQLLHEILIAPIADLLPTDPESPVIFIPHYALFLVPFAALQNPQGRYFIEDHTPLIAPSIEVLKHTQTQHQQVRGTQQKALVVAEPTLHQNFQEDPYKLRPYPFMEAAAESIATILETTAITGDKATKVAVINGMLETRIVHIFAHGLLDEYKPDEIANGRIPGTIVLAPADGDDGALNAAEIIDKELNCEMVVLSACSTGKGTITGDGIIGLSRCFILAGVPSLIVSLWNIGAPAAKVLMTQFYQNLANGENRGAALRHAMMETKARFPNPECWAGFTLIGETTSLTLTTQNIEEALRTMSIPENATPKAIVEAFTRLFDFYEQNFLSQIHGLDILPTDSIEQTAEKIKAWCKTHQNVEENIENDLCKMGLSDADDEQEELDQDKVKACYEKYLENLNRQGLKSDDSITTENDDSVSNS